MNARGKKSDRKEREKKLDQAIEMTFPASDPIAVGRPTSTEALSAIGQDHTWPREGRDRVWRDRLSGSPGRRSSARKGICGARRIPPSEAAKR